MQVIKVIFLRLSPEFTLLNSQKNHSYSHQDNCGFWFYNNFKKE